MPKRTPKEQARVDEIRASMVAYVMEYFEQWQKPLPLYKLSARSFRTLHFYRSSFQEQMGIIKERGELLVSLTEDGRYEVTPPVGAWLDRP